MRKFLYDHTPPGWEYRRELIADALLLLIVLFIACVVFGTRYNDSLNNIYTYSYVTRERVLVPGQVMSPFAREVSGCMAFFWAFVFTQIASAVNMYMSFSAGSKSIYLMRRLPDRPELPKRCIPMPVLAVLAGFAVCLLQLLVFRTVYMMNVPESALPPQMPVRLFDVFYYNLFQ